MMNINKSFVSCLLHTPTITGRTMSKWMKYIPPWYLRFAFNVEGEIIMYCCREVTESIPLISELSGNAKRRSEELEEMRVRREVRTMFAASIPILECEMYTQHTPSVCSDYRCQYEVVKYETFRPERSSLLTTIESVLQVMEIILNSRALKREMTKKSNNCNASRKFLARDRCSQSL